MSYILILPLLFHRKRQLTFLFHSGCQIPLWDPSQQPFTCLIFCMNRQNISVGIGGYLFPMPGNCFQPLTCKEKAPNSFSETPKNVKIWSVNPNLASRGANVRARTEWNKSPLGKKQLCSSYLCSLFHWGHFKLFLKCEGDFLTVKVLLHYPTNMI